MSRVKDKPAPRVSYNTQLIGEWRNYENKMNLPSPEQDRRFSAELQYREDDIALQAMTQFGDNLMKRAAWRVFARNTNYTRMIEIREMIGEVPIAWMEGIYHLYSPAEVEALVIYNALSRMDSREVTAYIEGATTQVLSNDVLIMQAASEGWALEDLLVRMVRVVEEPHNLHISTSLDDKGIDSILAHYNTNRDDIIELMDILTLRIPNDSTQRSHFYNANWVDMYAPWLILTSSADLQLAFMQYFDCYRLQLLYGSKADIDRLLNIVDPTRLALSKYFPSKTA